MSRENKYYVYAYTDPETEEFMYIGCGSGDRISQHLWPSVYNSNNFNNYPFYERIRELISIGKKPSYEKLEDGLSRKEAFKLEKELIRIYGRKILEEGPLLNISASRSAKGEILACPYCGERCASSRRVIKVFLSRHFNNCKCKGATDIYFKKPERSEVKTSKSLLLDDCETMGEFLIRRSFYGYCLGELTGDLIEESICDVNSGFLLVGSNRLSDAPGNRTIFDSFIKEDLLEYSLRGVSAINV